MAGEAWPRDGGRRGTPPDAGEACSGEAMPRPPPTTPTPAGFSVSHVSEPGQAEHCAIGVSPRSRFRAMVMLWFGVATPKAIHDVPDRGFREVFQVLKTCFPGAADRSRAPPGSATHGLLAAWHCVEIGVPLLGRSDFPRCLPRESRTVGQRATFVAHSEQPNMAGVLLLVARNVPNLTGRPRV